MASRYQVNHYGVDGNLVAIFDHYISLEFSHEKNKVTSCTLVIDGNSPKASLLEVDGRVEVRRCDHDYDIDWYTEWDGLLVDRDSDTSETGDKTVKMVSAKLLDLVNRRIVAAIPGSSGALISGPGETVIKTYVDEHAGPGATSPPRLEQDGVTPGLSIQTDGAGGTTWGEEDFSLQNLLESVVKVAESTGLVVDVASTGGATFEFRTYDTLRGYDRSTTGLDQDTGLNGAGNAPVIFSENFHNMKNVSRKQRHSSEKNTVFVVSDGAGDDMGVVVRVGSGASTSPLNQRECVVNAPQTPTTDSMNATGDNEIEANKAEETLSFDPIQVPGCMYGKHYWWGDLVSAKDGDLQGNFEIYKVQIKNDSSGEDISMRLGE